MLKRTPSRKLGKTERSGSSRPALWRVVGERMWHASQEIVPLKPDGSVIGFQVRLSGLEEITRWVLSWGSKAQVPGKSPAYCLPTPASLDNPSFP